MQSSGAPVETPNVVTAGEAAREKSCTRQAIYNAIARGELSGVQQAGRWLVLLNDRYRLWRVQPTGGRLHRRYLEKLANRNQD